MTTEKMQALMGNATTPAEANAMLELLTEKQLSTEELPDAVFFTLIPEAIKRASGCQDKRTPAKRAASKGRLRAYLNSLALKPQRVARSNRWACELCACPIRTGDEMRGDKKPAHESCFQAVLE